MRESYHWAAAISTVVCFIGGLVLAGSGDSLMDAGLAVLLGLLLMGLSVVAFVITKGWQYADDLAIGKKILAYTPVVLGGVLVFTAIFMLKMI